MRKITYIGREVSGRGIQVPDLHVEYKNGTAIDIVLSLEKVRTYGNNTVNVLVINIYPSNLAGTRKARKEEENEGEGEELEE